MTELVTHRGGCHCGAVRFEVDAPASIEALECNCTICSMTGFLHLIVPRRQFRLLSDPAALASYTFNTGVARHMFCRTCGIKPFYVPRSHPAGYDVNVRCFDPQPAAITIEPFDGRNWEQHAPGLAPLDDQA